MPVANYTPCSCRGHRRKWAYINSASHGIKSTEQMCLITYGKFQSVTRKIPTQTHTHTQNHHKYAFASPLFEMSPGNILNATLYIFISLSLAQRGGAHTTGSGEIIILWRSAGIRFLYAALSSRVWGDRKMTNVTADGGEWSKRSRTDRRRDREREGELGGKKKWWYLLFHPPLYSSRHGNMPGGPSREASSLTKTTESEWEETRPN